MTYWYFSKSWNFMWITSWQFLNNWMTKICDSNQKNANFTKKNRFFKFRNWTKRNQNWFKKNTNDFKMKIVYQRQKISIIFKIFQLQSKIHWKLFKQNHIIDQFHNKKQILIMKNTKTKNIRRIQINMHRKFNIQNV